MVIARGRNVWDYAGNRVVIDREKLRAGLDEILERGTARKSARAGVGSEGSSGANKRRRRRGLESIEGRELTDPHAEAERAIRPAIEELREARDFFDQNGDRLLAEALEALRSKVFDTDFAVLTHRAKRIVNELRGQPADLRAAAVYEFLGRKYSQDQIASEYGVSRYDLQARLPQAERIMQRLDAA